MPDLPRGTVTMLFSDIEGSTALLSRLGDRYAEALSAQRAVLRGAIGASHGHELGTEGDSFFVVFESAGDAVRCCVAVQRARAHGPYGWGARLVSHCCGSLPLGREGAWGAGSGRRLGPCAVLPLASRQP